MSPDPIDLPSALKRIGGEKEFLRELLEIFETDYREKADRLKKAVETGDFESLKNIGHALKGASANLSLEPLKEACRSMEEAGEAGDTKQAGEALARMEAEHARLRAFLPGIFP
ncbi:MAG: Hpt domain-containing protein [Candidatus Aminicenantes bacterium]|nr:Hpt domain-containing protein [Candidatus Aminicenantes bacterium]